MAGIILTNAGKAALANAHLAGEQVVLTHMAVGDGNGNAVTPNEDQVALVNEVHRDTVDDLYTDPDNANWVVSEMAIPAETGGWYVREVGIIDDKEASLLLVRIRKPSSRSLTSLLVKTCTSNSSWRSATLLT